MLAANVLYPTFHIWKDEEGMEKIA
jgi:hypothetical protein